VAAVKPEPVIVMVPPPVVGPALGVRADTIGAAAATVTVVVAELGARPSSPKAGLPVAPE
jgi:hypothetical protein